jgi:hypothetical protein
VIDLLFTDLVMPGGLRSDAGTTPPMERRARLDERCHETYRFRALGPHPSRRIACAARGRNLIHALTLLVGRREPVFRGDAMADISKFSIVTYERKPGRWRAAITRKDRSGDVVSGEKVQSVVTPDDYASESEAELAARKLISKL